VIYYPRIQAGTMAKQTILSGSVYAYIVYTLIFFVCVTPVITAAQADDVTDLNKQLESNKKKIDELEEKSKLYQKTIELKRKEAITLRNQVALLESEVEKATIDLQIKNRELEEQNLAIVTTQAQITKAEERIHQQKERLSYVLRSIYALDKTSPIHVVLENATLSDYFQLVGKTSQLQQNLQITLNTIRDQKTQLLAFKTEQETYKTTLGKIKGDIEEQRESIKGKQFVKADLLEETKNSERKFQTLLGHLKKEQSEINSDIVFIEKKLREKLSQKEQKDGLGYLVGEKLMWPVPKNTITAYFHDPDYPFRNIFEHPAVDIRSAQGTAVRSAASGYIGRAKHDVGCAGNYAYVLIVHADGLSTVYGHLSKITVDENQFVRQGDIIGLSGAAPGSCGSGKLTTGSHLHLEVRKNGIPVDPLAYLP